MPWPLVGGLAAMAVALGWLFYVGTKRQRMGLGAVFVACSFAIGLWWTSAPPPAAKLSVNSGKSAGPSRPGDAAACLPQANHEAGYVSSGACRDCHPQQYASWHRTFHRTMTQKATPEAVVPEWDDVMLSSRGRTYRLFRNGEEFWVDTVDPIAEVQAFLQGLPNSQADQLPRAERRIDMTTGSHYHQTYWMQNPNGTLIQFPWVYHIDSGRWVYRIDSFLRPPNDKVTFNIWNLHCIDCHATAGEPRVDEEAKSMHSVGELGIACEACHGPAQEHVQLAQQGSEEFDRDRHIVNPRRLDAVESGRVCGQCHLVSDHRDPGYWARHGDPYRPGHGEDFDTIRKLIVGAPDVLTTDENFGTLAKSCFWPDGTVRTGGREYNGMILSKCYLDGQQQRRMSCLSCHSMHNYVSPSKLMAKGLEGNRMCVQCHQEQSYTTLLSQHTHHASDSAGSQCVNCHMPHTSYALFSATRSHRIQSPRVRVHRGARPNACNLCHLDQTKSWTASRLREWYGIESEEVAGDDAELAAGAVWGLKGDASQRAMAAWHFGWEPAQSAGGTEWVAPVLAEMLLDPYAAVRYIAFESLKTLPDYRDLEFDFDGSEEARREARNQVLAIWNRTKLKARTAQRGNELLLTPEGKQDLPLVRQLLDQQDDRPISLLE